MKSLGIQSPAHDLLIEQARAQKIILKNYLDGTNREWHEVRATLEKYISYQVAADHVAGYLDAPPKYKP